MLIRGPKSCGKTETAKRYAKSIVQLDRDEQVPVVIQIDPKILLAGPTPRLLDEWQEQPKLWNYVRHAVDERKEKGQFILTGCKHYLFDQIASPRRLLKYLKAQEGYPGIVNLIYYRETTAIIGNVILNQIG